MKIDGFVRVVTDEEGSVLHVIDSHFDNDNLDSYLGSTEIIDMMQYIDSKDAEVLIPLTYWHEPASYGNGVYSDPDEGIEIVAEYILKNNFRQWLTDKINSYDEKKKKYDSGDIMIDACETNKDSYIEWYEEIYNRKFDN